MEGPCRSTGSRLSRRSRSRRDRERRRRRRRAGLGETRACSPSSGSEREEAAGPGVGPGGGRLDGGDNRPAAHNNRPRPPRRRKKDSVSCEEDFIDGFAIASFISLEALEKDVALKPQERAPVWERRSGKRKRAEERGLTSEPEERREGESSEWERERERANGMGEPGRRAKRKRKRRRRRRGREGSGHTFLETGYVCDTESDSDDRTCDADLDQPFTVSTSTVPESAVNGPTPLSLAPRLSVTPKISGIQRSQERNQEPDSAPYLPTEPPNLLPGRRPHPTSSSSLPKEAERRQPKPHGKGLHHPFSSAAPVQAAYGTGLGFNSRCNTPSKTPTSSSSSSSSSSSQLSLHRPSTPSSLALALNPPSQGGRAPSVWGSVLRAGPDPAGAELSLPHRPVGEGGADRAGAGRRGGRGPAASTAPTGSGTAPGPASIGPLAFQFHQHNHQHTHTHQHYTPSCLPAAAAAVVPEHPAAPMFEKYPVKMDGLYRHSFYPTYPPSVSGLPPVLPPAGTFSSLQGAFQPKTTNPDIAARLGAVPHPCSRKIHVSQIHSGLRYDTCRLILTSLISPVTSSAESQAPGPGPLSGSTISPPLHPVLRWRSLQTQPSYTPWEPSATPPFGGSGAPISHMQADPHKPDFPSDLLSRVPGSGSVGPLSGAHDLSRPSTLFSAGGAVHPGSSPFAPPTGPPNPFLTRPHT
ncbi:putative fibrosin-1 isoform X6 [Acipenser oxyrinchus oxyrinchus]|uniref:Fibrosin-1 isoform X6 n=1 Tax=Acipenser oxyrinchus oxyrinchus TaxID=40147 RepID=A0AAD8CLP3_ACIOX|nr:putative fibrosin-1 isoform X6 [Acipenser oxyrinchus oxyrinchus]